jgi:hypothetical protein
LRQDELRASRVDSLTLYQLVRVFTSGNSLALTINGNHRICCTQVTDIHLEASGINLIFARWLFFIVFSVDNMLGTTHYNIVHYMQNKGENPE